MRTKFVYILLLLTTVHYITTAQDQPEKGKYYPNPEQSVFDGEWVYSKNGEVFKITIKNQQQYYKEVEFSTDKVEGYHSYTKDGKVLQSSYGGEKTLTLGSIKGSNNKTLSFFFKDLASGVTGTAKLELLPNKKNVAKWTLSHKETVRINATEPIKEFEVPREAIFQRIN
jgi:hypothetical protein